MTSVLLPRDLADWLDQAAREEQCGYGDLIERMLLTPLLAPRGELRANLGGGRLTEKVQFRLSKDARRALGRLRGRGFTKSEALRALIRIWYDRARSRAPLPSPPIVPAGTPGAPPQARQTTSWAPPVRPAATAAPASAPRPTATGLPGAPFLTQAQKERLKAYRAGELSCRYCHSGAWGTIIEQAEHEQLEKLDRIVGRNS